MVVVAGCSKMRTPFFVFFTSKVANPSHQLAEVRYEATCSFFLMSEVANPSHQRSNMLVFFFMFEVACYHLTVARGDTVARFPPSDVAMMKQDTDQFANFFTFEVANPR